MTHGLPIGNVLVRITVSTAAAATSATTATTPLVSWSGSPVTVSGYVRGRPLLLLIVELLVERNGFAIVQRFEAILVDLGIMDKDVFRAIGRGDEPEALVAKKLDCTLKRHAE